MKILAFEISGYVGPEGSIVLPKEIKVVSHTLDPH